MTGRKRRAKGAQLVVFEWLERVGLIAEASQALANLRERSGYSRADIVNQALQFYAGIRVELDKGQKLALIDGKTGAITLCTITVGESEAPTLYLVPDPPSDSPAGK